MSRKSKRSSLRKEASLALDRPFAPAILRQAKELASQYRLILEPDEQVGFIGSSIEMPFVWGDGTTPDECVRETLEALTVVIATMLEMGESPSIPSKEEQRNEQVNIRLTPREKLLMEAAAQRKGFRGISDFVRTTTLSQLRSA